MKRAPAQDPIEGMMRQWLDIHVALVEDRDPPISMGTFLRGTRGMTQRVGDAGFERIINRLSLALREIVEGAPAPPLAQLSVDGLTAVEADMIGERLVAEYRRRGVKRTNDPNWHTELRRKSDLAVERHIETLKARYAKPQPQPAPLQRVTLPATVTAQTRSTEPDLPAMRYAGVWEQGREYLPGMVVSHRGTTWHCGIPTKDKPGTSRDWQMMAKTPAKAA